MDCGKELRLGCGGEEPKWWHYVLFVAAVVVVLYLFSLMS